MVVACSFKMVCATQLWSEVSSTGVKADRIEMQDWTQVLACEFLVEHTKALSLITAGTLGNLTLWGFSL